MYDYESGYTMKGQRTELILIAAYDLCHPTWSKGLIKQEIWRGHKIKVIKMNCKPFLTLMN